MKYSINVYNPEDGSIKGTYGTDFISTNAFIKAVGAMKEIEGEKDIESIVGKIASVVSFIIPSLSVDEIMDGCDVGDMVALVKQVVAKMSGVESSKN